MSDGTLGLKKSLSGLHLWGIAVGLVGSAMESDPLLHRSESKQQP